MADTTNLPFDRRTFALGVANGALFISTIRLVDPGALLSLLVLRLTDSAQMIGVMSFCAAFGWFWPALVVGNLLEHRKRKMPYYRAASYVRMVTLWSTVAIMFTGLPLTAPLLTFWLIAMLSFVQNSASGVCYIPFMDIVGKSIPSSLRGLFLALRMGIAEVLGFGNAALAGYFLSERSGLGVPRSFGAVLALAAVLQTASMLTFAAIREPVRPVQRRQLAYKFFFQRGLRIFRRDSSFRNFTLLRVLYTLGFMAMPFVAAFARQDLHVTEATVACYMAVNSIAVLVANLLWGRLGDARGNRTVLRVYSAMSGLPVLLALAAAHTPGVMVALPFAGIVDLRVALVGGVFFLSGLAAPARLQGEANYILDLAPERRRSTYLAFGHTTVLPLTLVPVFAGWMAQNVSYSSLFATALVFAGLTNLVSAIGLREPRLVGNAPRP